MTASPQHAAGPTKSAEVAGRKRSPEVSAGTQSDNLVPAPMSVPVALLKLQRKAGNQAVQRALGRSRPVIQREGDPPSTNSSGGTGVLYADPSGVVHDKPDPSKAPPVIHLDAEGVGHKTPDKSKTPSVIFMDAEGVGHKKPDGSKTPSVLHMDASGVGHAKADEVAADLAGAHKAIKGLHDKAMPEVASIKKTFAMWAKRLKRATDKEKTAEDRANEGFAKWNVEREGSGLYAAKKSELSIAAGVIAMKAYNDSAAQKPSVEASAQNLLKQSGAWAKNSAQFGKDKARWLKSGSPLTIAATNEVQGFLDAEKNGGIEALGLHGTMDAELLKIKLKADSAVDFGVRSKIPLEQSGGGPWVITGMLQQKLNTTRAGGAARLPVHADFDAATEAALRTYQGTAGIPVTGVADVATWTALDAAAPSTVENNQLGPKSKDGAQEAAHLNGQMHPNFKFGSKGPGVHEMQTRLNNWVAVAPNIGTFKPLKVDSSFGFADKSAIKKFQKAVGIPESGECDQATWTELDKVAGAVSQGEVQFDWRESVEGIDNVGMTSKYAWEVKGTKITITVNMQFTGKKNHAMVGTWLQDIKDIWNSYKAVQVGGARPREFDIEFNPVKSSSGFHKVKVCEPTAANPNPRSDAANWYVNDQRKGLAPHEFGHLIGLEDEYNRPEEQAVAVSGLEPTVGQVTSSTGKSAKEVSDEIKGVIDANMADRPAMITALAAKVAEHGMTQGAFARLVATKFEADYGFGGQPDMSRYIATLGNDDWTGTLTRATKPFLVTNQSLMGNMQSGMGGARNKNFGALADHEHPVQPRHVRAFANLATLAYPGTQWEPRRR